MKKRHDRKTVRIVCLLFALALIFCVATACQHRKKGSSNPTGEAETETPIITPSEEASPIPTPTPTPVPTKEVSDPEIIDVTPSKEVSPSPDRRSERYARTVGGTDRNTDRRAY